MHRDDARGRGWGEEPTPMESDPAFEAAYEQMMEKALAESRGERKRRLLKKHGHGEQKLAARIWWPVVGNLDHLNPEWEIRDLRNGVNFADYAYLPNRTFGLLLECDGFGPHWRDISRWDFDHQEERQNLLLIDEWKLLRFSYDAIKEKSVRCQQTLRYALKKWGQLGGPREEGIAFHLYERAILHLMSSSREEWMTPVEISNALKVARTTLAPHLKSLVKRAELIPKMSATGRAMEYKLSGLQERFI